MPGNGDGRFGERGVGRLQLRERMRTIRVGEAPGGEAVVAGDGGTSRAIDPTQGLSGNVDPVVVATPQQTREGIPNPCLAQPICHGDEYDGVEPA